MKRDPIRIALPEGEADLLRREVRFRNGHRSRLTGLEVDLLRYVGTRSGRVVSRDEILAQVWRLNPDRVVTRTVDMHISLLRDKLQDDARHPRVLLTVHGQGYMLASGNGMAERRL
jgi:DNA-binding response OmpR family regulator